MKQSQTQRHHMLFYTLYLTYISTGIIVILPGPTLPILAQHTGVPLDIAGWAFTASALGLCVGVLTAGALTGRMPPKYILLMGLTAVILSGFITPVAPLFLILLVAQFAQGFGLGSIDVSVNVITGIVFQETLGETLNNLHSSYGVGALIAPTLLSLALQTLHNSTVPYLIGAVIGIVCFFVLLRIQLPSAVPARSEQTTQPSVNLLALLKQALLWLLALQLALYVGTEIGFSNWIVTAISQSAVTSLAIAAPAATLFWLGLTIGRLLGAQLLKRSFVGESQLLYIAMIGSGICGILIAIFSNHLAISFITSGLVGFFLGPIFPGVLAIASRWFAHALGTVSTVMLISAGIASMILPVLMGFLIPVIGVHGVIAIPAVVALLITIPLSLALYLCRSQLMQGSEDHKGLEEGTPTYSSTSNR